MRDIAWPQAVPRERGEQLTVGLRDHARGTVRLFDAGGRFAEVPDSWLVAGPPGSVGWPLMTHDGRERTLRAHVTKRLAYWLHDRRAAEGGEED